MKYLVMECHLSYAVVLDEEGQFRKVANLSYEIGQTVNRVIEMEEPEEAVVHQPAGKKTGRWAAGLVTMAACMALIVTSVLTSSPTPYGTVYLAINPEVRMDVDREDQVIGLSGVNTDGQILVNGYAYEDKPLELVTDELIDLAIDMGFLYAGGTVTLTLEGEDEQWVVNTGDSLGRHLQTSVDDSLGVTIQVNQVTYSSQSVTIPTGPDSPDSQEVDQEESQPPPQPLPRPSAPGEPAPEPVPELQPAPEPAPPPVASGDSGYGASAYEGGSDYGEED